MFDLFEVMRFTSMRSANPPNRHWARHTFERPQRKR